MICSPSALVLSQSCMFEFSTPIVCRLPHTELTLHVDTRSGSKSTQNHITRRLRLRLQSGKGDSLRVLRPTEIKLQKYI